ncbi:hypothetical protein MMYC01_207243 [Madurella mycetomatis]|uniref:Secreted protein n=1 Tax=Madurella mycetomatis TaxID=100816 RepID=A0A175VY50_9PEZI|nr:hypothetical protein MMYC01_207243 [Madurella mycetomatis]
MHAVFGVLAATAATAATPAPQELIVPCQAIWTRQHPVRDSSHCHPVFFTDKLRRPPFTVLSGPQSSPVAHGYAYQDAPRGVEKSAGPRL